MPNKILDQLLGYAQKLGASDTHLTQGDFPAFRVNGTLKKMDKTIKLDLETMKKILLELLGDNEERFNEFFVKKDMDFAYMYNGNTPFRVNAFFKLGKIGVIMRMISSEAMTMEQINLPESAHKFAKAKQGIILVTGPTGSGKSTSMVSIINEINKTRDEHIITIEDPVEFVFKDEKSIFSQREVGNDTQNFSSALRSAMREDPDIVMVGEMRDKETVEAALELADTGHLVFSTLHTAGSVSTINRLISFFPSDMENTIRQKLADTLFGVLSQRLIKKADGNGRIGIYEIMMATSGIRNLIRTGNVEQINSTIETGTREGMILMKDYADKKRDEGIIKEEEYINFFKDEMASE